MSERILAKLPSMTADERSQLRRNCERAIERAGDPLVAQEARRIIDELSTMEQREAAFLCRQSPARQIEYAFRRRPADARERRLIVALHGGNLRLPEPLQVGAAADAAGHLALDAETEDRQRLTVRPAWVQHLEAMCAARRHLLPLTEDCTADGACDRQPICGGGCPLVGADEAESRARLSAAAVTALSRVGYIEADVTGNGAGVRPPSAGGLPMPASFSPAASSPAGTPAE